MNKNKNNTETIDLLQLIRLVLSKIVIVIIAAILCGGAAFSVSYFMIDKQYQSYTSLYVKNANANKIDENTSVNLNDLNASKSLVNTYIAVLSDDAVMEKVGDRLLNKVDPARLSQVLSVDLSSENIKVSIGSLKSCITMAAVNQTEVLRVTAVTKDPEISAIICNTVAEIAPDVLIRVVGAGSVEAIGEAKVMNTPVSPNKTKNTLLGAFAGIVIAVAFIIIKDLLDNTVKSSKELADRFDKPIIGEIQEFGDGKKEAKKAVRSTDVKRSTILDKGTPYYIKESYKAMRTNIVFSLSQYDRRVFAVSSSNAGEGKSTTSVNIAIAMAQAEHKVLLIDGDMRKPIQHKVFGKNNHHGLSNVISGLETLEKAIHKNVVDNLDFMSAGPKPPNPSELLASEKCASMLEQLGDDYDYVIIDTPPLNVVSDAMGISKSVAGLIMVTRYSVTPYEAIEDACGSLDFADMKLLGFVLNDISLKDAGSKYGGYGKYGKYGHGKYGYGKYGYGKYGYSSYGYGYGEAPEDQEEETKEEKTSKSEASEKKASSENKEKVSSGKGKGEKK